MSQIAQYVENYLDLIENSPNEIIRQITRLHEKNHLYSKLNDKLQEMLKILVDKKPNELIEEANKASEEKEIEQQEESKEDNEEDENKVEDKLKDNKEEEHKEEDKLIDNKEEDKQLNKEEDREEETKDEEEDEKITLRKQKALNSVKRYLLEIQEIADEKLSIVQSILEHLDCKNKQLEFDFRNLTTQQNLHNSNTNSKSNSNSSSQNTNDEDSLSGNQENSNSELNYQKEQLATAIQSNQSNVNNNNHHHSSNSSKRASSRRNLSTGTSSKEFSSNNNELNSSSHNNNSNNNGAGSSGSGTAAAAVVATATAVAANNSNNNGNHHHSSNHASNHKRGVKRGGGVNKNSNREIKRNRSNSNKDLANSPSSNLYDPDPIDPDEPTYCVCEQVSFGEMICCDNAACVIEWFHFSCVSLATKPKGKWFCPNCRGERSNICKVTRKNV